MKGIEGIQSLRLEVLTKLIENLDQAPDMMFSNMFGTSQYPSDTIKWEVAYGSGGMTPFVAPGAVSPKIGIDGRGEGSAQAAFTKEAMFFGEDFLNNLRQPGTYQERMTAERMLARGVQKLSWRCDRRRNWSMAKMLIDGEITYVRKGGVQFTVNYGVPDTHKVTVSPLWNASSPTVIEDIFDAKKILAKDAGVAANNLISVCNTEVLRTLMTNADFRDLLTKSNFGNGDLFQNPAAVIGNLLGLGTIRVMDDFYEIPAWFTANAAIGASDIYVDNVSDFEVNGEIRLYDLTTANSWEDAYIGAVDVANNKLSLVTTYGGSTAYTLTKAYVAGRDKVTMHKKYVGDDVFFMYSPTFEGEPIAEMMEAPYGIPRRFGKKIDTHMEWDPDGIILRVQDKFFPVLYYPTTTMTLTVQ